MIDTDIQRKLRDDELQGKDAETHGAIVRTAADIIDDLILALQKVKEWVDDEGWCPICDEHHCRKDNCILADVGDDDGEEEYDYAADDFAFDAAREDAYFRR